MRQIRDPQFVSSEQCCAPPWMATIEQGTSLEDVMNPAYWANIARKVHMLDEIRCYWEDGSLYAKFLVVKATGVDVHLKALTILGMRDTESAADLEKKFKEYEINYAGPAVGYRIVRLADHVTIHSDIKWNQDDAERWLLASLSQPNRAGQHPVAAAKPTEAPKPPQQQVTEKPKAKAA